ncbi:hypothetical protein PQZ07_00595 [bacterium]|nr:hypothetical protein [bacterium]
MSDDFHFTYHGNSLDIMDWNLHNLGDAETRRLHKDNITYNEWMDKQRQVLVDAITNMTEYNT